MPRHIHRLTVGLSATDLLPMPSDAPADVIDERFAVARELDVCADAREAALRDTLMVGREITNYEMRHVDRTFALIRYERSVAAALRHFHLRGGTSQHAADNGPSRAGVGRLHIRALGEGPGVSGVTVPQSETGSPIEKGALPDANHDRASTRQPPKDDVMYLTAQFNHGRPRSDDHER